MAKRRGSFDPQGLESDPRLRDESADLWNDDFGDVARGLLTSAVRCFAANGYHATTTRDIASVVGLSPAALYVHFPSKEDVLFEISRSAHERVLLVVQDPLLLAIDDAPTRFGRLVSRYTAWHARHHVAARVAQFERAGLSKEHHDEILQLRHVTNEIFRYHGSLVADSYLSPEDMNRVIRAILSLSIDLVRWYRLNGPDSPEELGDFYAGLAIRMLQSPVSAPTSRLGDPEARART
jgi:AcrR family transcriptional regulator